MENASKALLIAGAILIAIVLISIGMMILSSSQDVLDSVGDQTTSQAVTTFNTTFTAYQGTQKGSAIRSLLQTVSSNNATNTSTSEHIINVIINSSKGESLASTNNSTELLQAAANIVSSAKYKVVMSAVDSEGYITEITITR